MLVIHIAHTEDAARYQGPVRFWNSQLSEVLGFKSPKQLNEARRHAIESGWLHYERKHDRADGLYWTLIPKRVERFDDEPIEEMIHSANGKETNFYSEFGTGSGTGSGKPPIPNPNPNPKEKRPRFVAPTLDDVRAYCAERQNKIDPEQFVDHYQANGWTQGRGKPIRDWKAAVRTWERNGFSQSSSTADDDPYADLRAKKSGAKK